jgi:hypothetical protein
MIDNTQTILGVASGIESILTGDDCEINDVGIFTSLGEETDWISSVLDVMPYSCGNTRCDQGETYQNCPADCPPPMECTPGAKETVPCPGNGVQTRTCDSTGHWNVGPCHCPDSCNSGASCNVTCTADGETKYCRSGGYWSITQVDAYCDRECKGPLSCAGVNYWCRAPGVSGGQGWSPNATRSCGNGGTQTCAADGSGWGPCVGCGNGFCDGGEDVCSCPQDCGGPSCVHMCECFGSYGCGIAGCTAYCCAYGQAHGTPDWCNPGNCDAWCSCR